MADRKSLLFLCEPPPGATARKPASIGRRYSRRVPYCVQPGTVSKGRETFNCAGILAGRHEHDAPSNSWFVIVRFVLHGWLQHSAATSHDSAYRISAPQGSAAPGLRPPLTRQTTH
jgi:hypothetical protein